MAYVLLVHSSARNDGSHSRPLGAKLAADLAAKRGGIPVVVRDVAALVPVSEGFVNATFVPADARTADQKAVLAASDALVEEAQKAAVIVLTTPMYNFGPAAGLKSWADNIARIGVTFEYGADGKPVGKLTGKEVFTVVSAGGVPEGAPYDAVSPWLKAFLPFVGLTGNAVVWQRGGSEEGLKAANDAIDALIKA
jgi:FMN-dependent NADH-azoreductase